MRALVLGRSIALSWCRGGRLGLGTQGDIGCMGVVGVVGGVTVGRGFGCWNSSWQGAACSRRGVAMRPVHWANVDGVCV